LEQTKAPTRDYPLHSLTPWGLWDVLYGRRSHRKYLPTEIDEGFIKSLGETARLAVSVRGAGDGDLMVVTDSERVQMLKRGIHKGAQGKINLWSGRAPLSGFLVLALPKNDVRSERPLRLPLAVMAAEDIVLWLAERGLGTCWLGGINQKEVRAVMGLGGDMFAPAVIPFGKPKPRVKARDIDHIMYKAISSKRKPLSSIAYRENMDHPYNTGNLAKEPFSASPIQDIVGLLNDLKSRRESDAGVPLELVADACLEAARIAPSAGNAQKWRFVVVREEDAIRELARACGVENAWRMTVVGVGDPEEGFFYQMMEKPFWMIDLPIAFSQMSLMAASMGLALDLRLSGFDEMKVEGTVGVRGPLRAVGVMGIR
jgi:nitroreductase